MNNITFEIISHGTPEYLVAVRLREEILRKSLGLVFLPEELEQEKNHIQIVGVKDDEIIACAVLVPEGVECKMQRVAVRACFQNAGAGSLMMKFCETHAKAQGFKSIYCHARDSAVQFYLKNLYVPEGDYFDEDTIPHLKMRICL
jgi:predicted GNAT family N-acyltransferase